MISDHEDVNSNGDCFGCDDDCDNGCCCCIDDYYHGIGDGDSDENDIHDNFDDADDNDLVNPGYAGEPNEVAGDADKQDEELLSVSARGQKF